MRTVKGDSLARAADSVILLLVAMAFAVDLIGGFRVGRGAFRLSAHDPVALLAAAAGIAAVRHVVRRRPTLRDRLRGLVSRTGADEPHGRPAGRLTWWAAIAVLAIAAAVLLHQQILQLNGVPDRGDPLFSMWRLAWIAHQLRRAPFHLFDANIFYPAGNTLAYSDATLLPGLLTAPFLWAGMPVATAHGVLFVLSFVAAGLAMFALAWEVTQRMAPSLTAGLMFAFYPYRFSTYSHLEMQGLALMPLALLFLLRVLRAGRWRDARWLGVVSAGQVLWSFYLGAYLAVGLAAVAAGLWLVGSLSLRRCGRQLALAAAIALIVVLPYSRPYWRAEQTVGSRGTAELSQFSASPKDYLTLTSNSGTWGSRLPSPVNGERALFPGGTAVALSVLAVVPPAGPVTAAAMIAALVSVDATLGLNGLVFRSLYGLATPFRAFRVPARFGMVLGLFVCLLAAIGLRRLERLARSRPAVRVVLWAVIAFAVLEARPHLELTPAPHVPSIYLSLSAEPGAPIVDLPVPEDDSEFLAEPTYVYYSTFHWHPLLNGYSGFTPSWYGRLQAASRDLPSDSAVSTFRDAGARYLVLHETYYPPGRYREIVLALDARRDLTLIATEPAQEGERRLYRFATR
jgi:hypothetical protein